MRRKKRRYFLAEEVADSIFDVPAFIDSIYDRN